MIAVPQVAEFADDGILQPTPFQTGDGEVLPPTLGAAGIIRVDEGRVRRLEGC